MGKVGKLVFKGDKNKKAKKKTSRCKPESSTVAALKAPPEEVHVPNSERKIETQIKPWNGKGTITTSSTVVNGYGTAFNKQLNVGDAIIAGTVKGQEMRVVKMVLSAVSLSISSAFSSDLQSLTPYQYISKPRDVSGEKAAKLAKAKREQEETEQRAMGTYGNKGEMVYRERTDHGSYRIKTEQATTDMSRSDLLSYRSSKKSDRYC